MAVLGRIRKHSVLLLIIVGLAMLAFILGDILTSSSQINQSRRDKVVTINGQKITYEQFETARQQRSEFYKTLMGRDVDSDATQQLTQEVYNQFVTNSLVDDLCEDYGLTVTTDELSDLLQGDNVSPLLQQIFGQQAKMIAQLFIQLDNSGDWEMAAQQYGPWASKANWEFLKEQIVAARKIEKFQGLLANSIKPNKLEAEDYFNGDNTDYTFAFVRQTAGQVADSLVNVKNEDLNKYFDSTKRLWKVAGQRRNVEYIAVPLRPSQADFAEAEQDINNLRDEFATSTEVAELVNGNSVAPYVDAFIAVRDLDEETREFVESHETGDILEPHRTQGTYFMMARIMDKTIAPDSIQVSMVVVPTKEEADSLVNKVLKAGNDITGYSNQQFFNGWITDAAALQSFNAELRDVLFSTAKGESLVKSINLGQQTVYYAIKVTDKTAPVAKAKVAIYATEVTPSTTTRREEYGKLNQFLTANKTVKAMQDSALNAGYAMMPTTIYATSYTVGQVNDARPAVRFTFNGEKGDVSEIFEAGENLLVVAITGDVEEGFQSLSNADFNAQLTARVLPSKKVAYLKEKFDAIQGDLEAYASAFNAQVDTAKFANFNSRSIIGLGTEPAIVEAAIKAGEGNVAVATGRNTVAAVKLLASNQKSTEYNEEVIMNVLARSAEYSQAVNGALSALQYNSEIEDNRISFY